MRNISSKYPGTEISSFRSEDLNDYLLNGLCAEDETDSDSVLSTTKQDCFGMNEVGFPFDNRRYPFYQCKNNCPGGR